MAKPFLQILSENAFVDATGAKLASGILLIQSVDASNNAIPFRVGSDGNSAMQQSTKTPIQRTITNGAVDGALQLANPAITNPQNIGYTFTVTDSGSGVTTNYASVLIQDDGSGNWNLGALATGQYIKALPVTVVQGPPGTRGVPGEAGQAGPAGTTTLAGSNGAFNAQGGLQANSSVPEQGLSSVLTSDQVESGALYLNKSLFGDGWNLGNYGGWKLVKGVLSYLVTTMRGIKQYENFFFKSYGIGDTAGIYAYVDTVPSGMQDPSAEATTGITVQVAEFYNTFRASIGSTTGTGDTQPTYTAFLSGDAGTYAPADGGIMVNLSKGTVAGKMTAVGSNVENWLAKMPITVTAGAVNGGLPLCTAWGAFGDTIPATNKPASQYQTVTLDVHPKLINGTAYPFVVGTARLLGGLFPEMVKITAVGSFSNGTQSITFQSRYPQGGGYLFQGGLAGQVMSFDANLQFSGKRTSHFIGGSVDGINVIYSVYLVGHGRNDSLPFVGIEAANPRFPALAGVHFYPGAENTATRSPMGSSTPSCKLEVNNIPWANGDSVECCFANYWGGHASWATDRSYTPSHPSYDSHGSEVYFGGEGKGGSYKAFVVRGDNPDSMYWIKGGPLRKPLGFWIESTRDSMPTRFYLGGSKAPDPVSVDHESTVLALGASDQYQGTHFNGGTTAGSNVISILHPTGYQSALGLEIGDPVSGPGIPANAVILAVNDYEHLAIGVPNQQGVAQPANAISTNANVDIVVYAPRYYVALSRDGFSIVWDQRTQSLRFGNTSHNVVKASSLNATNGYLNALASYDNALQIKQGRLTLEPPTDIFVNDGSAYQIGQTENVAITTANGTITLKFVKGVYVGHS